MNLEALWLLFGVIIGWFLTLVSFEVGAMYKKDRSGKHGKTS